MHSLRCLVVLASILALQACVVSEAVPEKTVAHAVANSAPLDQCPDGGITVYAGIDTNENAVLDESERTTALYVCNGVNGTNGADGADVLVAIASEPPEGGHCANGGSKVSVGPDSNGDGVLAAEEVTGIAYVCDGSNGSNGANGTDGLNALLKIEDDNIRCANGGKKLTSGLDTNRNGVLDDAEVTSTEYVCNGNSTPVANAGVDQRVDADAVVTLDGSASSDPNGNVLSYAWSITARPVGSMAMLPNVTVANPDFTPDKAGKYELSLVVNDGQVSSPADTVAIWVGMPLPDSGQTRWYSTVFGDDADYTINPMSYTDNGDGTVTDNVTGLRWQKCSLGQSGPDCATGTAGTYSWADATAACSNLELAGTGWRLPTDIELMSLVDYGAYSASIAAAYFPKTVTYPWYWASTASPNSTVAALVSFTDGQVNGDLKTNTHHARCVREM